MTYSPLPREEISDGDNDISAAIHGNLKLAKTKVDSSGDKNAPTSNGTAAGTNIPAKEVPPLVTHYDKPGKMRKAIFGNFLVPKRSASTSNTAPTSTNDKPPTASTPGTIGSPGTSGAVSSGSNPKDVPGVTSNKLGSAEFSSDDSDDSSSESSSGSESEEDDDDEIVFLGSKPLTLRQTSAQETPRAPIIEDLGSSATRPCKEETPDKVVVTPSSTPASKEASSGSDSLFVTP